MSADGVRTDQRSWRPAVGISEMVVCPVTQDRLVEADRHRVFEVLGESVHRVAANRASVRDTDVSATLLLRSDGCGAYPVVDGIPILMAPEMLVGANTTAEIDTGLDPYREAYEEMDFYNAVAADARADVSRSDAYQVVHPVMRAGRFPGRDWLDATYDLASQAEAYAYISPVEGCTTMQLGGGGIHAVKFLLAGAAESWLLTPMLGEAVFARALAETFGVADRFRAAVGIAEEIPLRTGSFDRVYSGGCLHHTITARAFPEIRRVLTAGGKFAAIEPWRAPGYRAGTKVFGKQERGVNCRPMEETRVQPLFRTFDNAAVIHHGTFTRYPLIALGKLGLHLGLPTMERITRVDDRLASKSSLRRYGSSIALMARATD